MQGYTARGVGTSAVDARFNCPPEVVLHTLLCSGPRQVGATRTMLDQAAGRWCATDST
jgi:hypothetical protein